MRTILMIVMIQFFATSAFADESTSQCYAIDVRQIDQIARGAGASADYKVNFDKGFFDQITFTLENSKIESSTGKTFYSEWKGTIVNSQFICREISGQAYADGACRYCIEY